MVWFDQDYVIKTYPTIPRQGESTQKKKNIKVNNNKIKLNFYSKNKRWFYKLDGCSIYSLTLT